MMRGYVDGSWWHGEHSFCPKLKPKNGALKAVTFFLVAISINSLIVCHFKKISIFLGSSPQMPSSSEIERQQEMEYTLNCSSNTTQSCRASYPIIHKTSDDISVQTCPEYFRWIHEDLKPWKTTGISKDMVESGKSIADIRVVIIDGKVYMEKYREVFQTRDVFTIWGILQLLRLYPGRLPDLDMLFGCGDEPMIKKRDYLGENAAKPPPIFHYCGNDSNFAIVFPDWTFWGWPEINIKPWKFLKEELEQGNNKINWKNREPYALWKGNVLTWRRFELMKCNVTEKQEWNARLYNLTWINEARKGFKDTNLANQCNHRYMIYIEGIAWSVSEKYILACDSMTLLITPDYYDFFSRSLVPAVHYWPINKKNMCKSIKFAVDWGNKYTKQAQAIGKAGSKFIQEELKLKHVYDYMFHLMTEYGKLLKYKPTVPEGAAEVCPEKLACSSKGLEKEFKMRSMENFPEETSLCTLPLPYTDASLRALIKRKETLTKHIQLWETTGNVAEDMDLLET